MLTRYQGAIWARPPEMSAGGGRRRGLHTKTINKRGDGTNDPSSPKTGQFGLRFTIGHTQRLIPVRTGRHFFLKENENAVS